MAAEVLYSDASQGLLSGSHSVGDTTYNLGSGEGALFPNPSSGQYFFVRIGTDETFEIRKVTTRNTSSLVGEALTQDWPDATPVALVICKRLLDEFFKATGGLIRNVSEYVETPSISSGVLTLDVSLSNVFKVSHSANITSLVFSNWPSTGIASRVELILTQDATGGRTLALPSACKYNGGTAVSISTTANKRNRLVFMTEDAGATIDTHLVGKDYA